KLDRNCGGTRDHWTPGDYLQVSVAGDHRGLASDDLHTGRVRRGNPQNGKPSAAKGRYQAAMTPTAPAQLVPLLHTVFVQNHRLHKKGVDFMGFMGKAA